MSFPKPDGEEITVLCGGDVVIDGWFATDKKPALTATLDGKPLEIRYGNRDEVRKFLPDHTWLVGWMIRITENALSRPARLEITLNGRKVLGVDVVRLRSFHDGKPSGDR